MTQRIAVTMQKGGVALQGVIVNRFRWNTIEHAGFIEEYRKHFGEALLKPRVPDRIAVPEAARWSRPIEFRLGRSGPAWHLPAPCACTARARGGSGMKRREFSLSMPPLASS